MQIETLIIVPARSGSKGIINKNIKPLGQQPLLAWTTAAIRQANLSASLAILSTDSEEYAALGRQFGLHVPFLRPADLASDQTSAMQVVQHALNWFQSVYHYLPLRTLWLQPTSPFRRAEDMSLAIEMMQQNQVDAVIACKEIQRDLSTLFNCENGFLSALDKQKITQISRQQTKPLLTPNGALYLCNTLYLMKNLSFYPEKALPLIMNEIQSLDIDTEIDWAIAEAYISQGLVADLNLNATLFRSGRNND